MRERRWIALLAAPVLFVILLLPLWGTLVDDSYIHFVYARNLAERGELSFNAGDPTYGATSPLWVALLAVVHLLGGDLVVWSHLLSAAFAIGSILLLYRIALRSSGCAGVAAAAALIMAAEAWVVRWSAVGMETSCALFMVIITLDAFFSAADSAGRSARFGIALFLATLARPEAVLIAPLALVAPLITRGGRTRAGFAWLAIFVPLYIAWLILIEGHTGTFFPLTAGAKQGRIDLSAALFRRALVPVRIMGATLGIPWLAIVAASIVGLCSRRSIIASFSGERRLDAGLSLLLIWAVGLPLVYVILDFQVLSRYLVPVAPAVILLALLGIDRLIGRREGIGRVVLAVVTAAVLIQNVSFYSIVVVGPTRDFSKGLEEVIGGMGRWLAENAESDALVAAPDIGAVGYYSGRRILDLGGLVSPEINEMRRKIDVERIIEEGRYLAFGADYLVDRSPVPDRFEGKVIDGRRFVAVVRGRVENLGITKPEPAFYVLYRIERVE